MGSVFSPHYARAHARGPVAPSDHVAFNVALYGRVKAWSFVEAAVPAAAMDDHALAVGASVARQVPGGLVLDVDAPRSWGRAPLRGQVRLRFGAAGSPRPFVLASKGEHRWWPRAPRARVEVDFPGLGVRWRGRAYHDLNWGQEPLAAGFDSWQWMRQLQADATRIDYVAKLAAGAGGRNVHLSFDDAGGLRRLADHRPLQLGRSGWGIARAAPSPWRLHRTLEDTPFYARSLLAPAHVDSAATSAAGQSAMHEALDLRRWRRGWVRFLLPFRLRRLGGGAGDNKTANVSRSKAVDAGPGRAEADGKLAQALGPRRC